MHDRSGSAPDPLVWDQGSERKQRKTHVDLASPWATWFLKWALGSGTWWLYHWF